MVLLLIIVCMVASLALAAVLIACHTKRRTWLTYRDVIVLTVLSVVAVGLWITLTHIVYLALMQWVSNYDYLLTI